MPRNKPAPAVLIRDLSEANQVLKEMCRLQTGLEEIDREVRDRIDALKSDALTKATPLRQRLQELEAGLNLFAACERERLFRERRTVQLVFGAFGWRRSIRINPQPKWTWAKVLDRVRSLGLVEAVRVREDLDREALHRWSDEKLMEVGAGRMELETFWYELSRDSVSDKLALSA
ncbi:MAG: host-nuclease inhibitor Gam family protein [Deltaproteobacteria bacterium]|nr:host-nuclease inhibitor Gam family protein [Deltaproteobacteria bacterium]